jgi:hypothetical protein
MKCISCELDINPQWKHAIDMNVCPFCGKHIMEEHLKNLLTQLRATMEELQKYPDQLDDFLISNYNYIKTDSPDLKSFLPKEAIKELSKEIDDAEFQEKKKSIVKIKTVDDNGKVVEQEVEVEKIQTDSKAQTFHERANNMLKAEKAVDGEPKSVTEKTRDLKKLKQQIEAAGAASLEEGNVASLISPGMLEQADPQAVAELQAAISGGDFVASGLPEAATGDDDAIPSVVLNMASRAGKKSTNAAERDMKTLQEMQNKVQSTQRKLGKGGFSRA